MDKQPVVMIRVYSDLQNIGYYSVLHNDGCVTYLPIIEKKRLRETPSFLDPNRVVDKCSGEPLSKYYRYSRYVVLAIHNDPRIDLGLYTEEIRGRLPKKIGRNTWILFVSGLAEYPEEAWNMKSMDFKKMLVDLKKRGKIGIYIVGGIIVDKSILIKNVEWDNYVSKYTVLMYSPHYYRLEDRETHAILGRGFWINPPLKIATLNYPRGYSVTRELLSLIGYGEAGKFVKQNFRKTRIMDIGVEKINQILSPYMEYV